MSFKKTILETEISSLFCFQLFAYRCIHDWHGVSHNILGQY